MKNRHLNILITGGGSGIGAAIAKALSADGHSVIICGRREKNLKEVAGKNKNISYHVCDVSEEGDILKLLEFVRERFARLDVLVNSAGIFGAIGRFDKTDPKLWKRTFETNTFGTYLVTKHFLGLLLRSDTKKIINFAGGGAFGTFQNYSAYAVSKAAVVRFSENIAEELADEGVKVNCVAPGFVATEIHAATLEAGEAAAGANFKRTQDKLNEGSMPMETVVKCVKYLLSPESGSLTGKTISASFDKWGTEEFNRSIEQINGSDLYTLRRMNLMNLDEKDELRKKLGK